MNAAQIAEFLRVKQQVQVYHWLTKSYAEHKALGEFYDALDDLLDTFIETYISGPQRQPMLFPVEIELDGVDERMGLNRSTVTKLLDDFAAFLNGEVQKLVAGNTDLENIRDEILGLVNRTQYQLTLA